MRYVQQFDYLSQYAPAMVYTETKKNGSLGTDEELKEVSYETSIA